MTDPAPLRLQGQRLFGSGDFSGALRCFGEALRVEPGHPETLRAAAITCLQLGRAPDAVRLFREVIVRSGFDGRPPAARAAMLYDLAVATDAAGAPAEARALYAQVLAVDPAHFPARLNLCASWLAALDFRAAEAASAELVARHPGEPEAWFNRTQALMAVARYDEAAETVERALALRPAHLGARAAKALLIAMRGGVEEAEGMLRSLASDPATQAQLPHYPQAAQTLRFDREALEHARRVALFERFRHGEWACFAAHRAALSDLAAALRSGARTRVSPMEAFQAMVLGLPHADYRTLVGGAVRELARDVRPLPPRPPDSATTAPRRLKVGYLSPAFRQHPGGYLFRKLFAAHDRSGFEVFAYAIGGDDGGPVRADIVAGVDHFVEVGGQSDEAIARRIRADGIDILVELEGVLDDTRPRVLAMRPAPIQVSYAGMMGMLEAPCIDYRFADRATDGDSYAERPVFEQPVFLPGSFLPYGCPDAPWQIAATRPDAGLPEDRFVFCSFNADFKFDPDTLAAWMRILTGAPEAVLWLLVPSDRQWAAIHALARGAGVDPGRIIRAARRPNDEFLARLRLADLFLDSFHCNAHTTALDALWMALPILTRRGPTPATRYCSSALADAGLPELSVDTDAAYVETALTLAHDPAAVQGLRDRLRAGRKTALCFDARRRAAHIESAYRQMWARHGAGLAPASFDVIAS